MKEFFHSRRGYLSFGVVFRLMALGMLIASSFQDSFDASQRFIVFALFFWVWGQIEDLATDTNKLQKDVLRLQERVKDLAQRLNRGE